MIYNTWRDIYIRDDYSGDHNGAAAAARQRTIEFNHKYACPVATNHELDYRVFNRHRCDWKTETICNRLNITSAERKNAGLKFLCHENQRRYKQYEPRQSTKERQVRNESIFKDLASGMTAKAVAVKYEITDRQIRNLKKKHPQQTYQ